MHYLEGQALDLARSVVAKDGTLAHDQGPLIYSIVRLGGEAMPKKKKKIFRWVDLERCPPPLKSGCAAA